VVLSRPICVISVSSEKIDIDWNKKGWDRGVKVILFDESVIYRNI